MEGGRAVEADFAEGVVDAADRRDVAERAEWAVEADSRDAVVRIDALELCDDTEGRVVE